MDKHRCPYDGYGIANPGGLTLCGDHGALCAMCVQDRADRRAQLLADALGRHYHYDASGDSTTGTAWRYGAVPEPEVPLTTAAVAEHLQEVVARHHTDTPTRCVGNGDPGAGCGYVGGRSGGTCPECGGILLSDQAVERADRLAGLLAPTRAATIERLSGPKTHICWTPDAIPKSERELVSLVREADLADLERRTAPEPMVPVEALEELLGQRSPGLVTRDALLWRTEDAADRLRRSEAAMAALRAETQEAPG